MACEATDPDLQARNPAAWSSGPLGSPFGPATGAPYDGRPMARLTRDDVAHVARLARLQLSDEELDTFTPQLGAILEHAADVEALDLAEVPPTSHPYPLVNVMRPDVARDAGIRDHVLEHAPAAEDDMFRVPPVLGEAP
jgi:aspartyl-tRNA(Asn)/glutamyl-tRNA(Gln) amidotransferase subunit C